MSALTVEERSSIARQSTVNNYSSICCDKLNNQWPLHQYSTRSAFIVLPFHSSLIKYRQSTQMGNRYLKLFTRAIADSLSDTGQRVVPKCICSQRWSVYGSQVSIQCNLVLEASVFTTITLRILIEGIQCIQNHHFCGAIKCCTMRDAGQEFQRFFQIACRQIS